MKFKSIMTLGLFSGLLMFTSCGDSTNVDEAQGINEFSQLDEFQFQEEVRKEEIRIEAYIVDLNGQIESIEEGQTEELTFKKTTAIKMLLEIRSDYLELTEETAANWVVFKNGINKLIPSDGEEINYAHGLVNDSSDSK